MIELCKVVRLFARQVPAVILLGGALEQHIHNWIVELSALLINIHDMISHKLSDTHSHEGGCLLTIPVPSCPHLNLRVALGKLS